MTHYTDVSLCSSIPVSSHSVVELANVRELSPARSAEQERNLSERKKIKKTSVLFDGQGGEVSEPPSCNTGAQSASVLIDWLSFTFPIAVSVESVLIELDSSGWSQMEKGLHGYRAGWVRGSVKVLYDGSPTMGVHVILSGQGCRTLEAMDSFVSWPVFLSSILAANCNVTRLDLAFDDREGLLQKDAIEAAINDGRVVSRYQDCRDMGKRSLSPTAEVKGWTRYFGSMHSLSNVRIYDKSLEQGITGEHYMRAELQTRKERAHRLAEFLAVKDTLEGLGPFMLGLLDFKERGTSPQRTRWASCSWWSDFLATVEKLRLTVKPEVRTIEALAEWLLKQVAPSLALVMEFPQGARLLGQMLVEGRGRWRSWHRSLLPAEVAVC